MKILNLTQHDATPEQIAAGVVEPSNKRMVQSLLTFNTLPNQEQIEAAAAALAAIARSHFGIQSPNEDWPSAMIGGAPFLMAPLERALLRVKIHPEYAFSVREVAETTQADGKVVKTAVFKHEGFVYATDTDDANMDRSENAKRALRYLLERWDEFSQARLQADITAVIEEIL